MPSAARFGYPTRVDHGPPTGPEARGGRLPLGSVYKDPALVPEQAYTSVGCESGGAGVGTNAMSATAKEGIGRRCAERERGRGVRFVQ